MAAAALRKGTIPPPRASSAMGVLLGPQSGQPCRCRQSEAALTSSWPRPQSCRGGRWSWCAGRARSGPSSDAGRGGSCGGWGGGAKGGGFQQPEGGLGASWQRVPGAGFSTPPALAPAGQSALLLRSSSPMDCLPHSRACSPLRCYSPDLLQALQVITQLGVQRRGGHLQAAEEGGSLAVGGTRREPAR